MRWCLWTPSDKWMGRIIAVTGWAYMTLAAAWAIVLLLMLTGCGSDDAPPQRPAQEPPAAAQARDLGERERAARLDAINATTKEEYERQTAIANELAKLRAEAERRVLDQQREIDGRARAAQKDADERASRLQAASDRRWAILAAASASAAAVAAGIVLAYLGMRGLAALIAIAVPAAAAVGVGILSAGPLLGWILGGLVVAAIACGAICGVRALRRERDEHAVALTHAVRYGEQVTEEIRDHLPDAINVLQDQAKRIAVQASPKAAAILTGTIRKVRAETAQHQAAG